MKRILAALLAAALALGGCSTGKLPSGDDGSQSSPGYVQLSLMALREPVYPDFPAYPQEPEDGDWAAYDKAYTAYYEALEDLRGEGLSQDAAAALTAFTGRSTFRALAGHEGENAVYSPVSLWSALAMLAQCAGGDSRQQVLDALQADDVEALQEQVNQVWRGLYTDDGASSLLLANSIWLNSSAKGMYVQETLDILAEQYYSGTYSVPMGDFTADMAITDWIAQQTNGLIGDGGAPVVQTSSETLALLASSLYYRAGWLDEFLPGLTEQDVFTNAGGSESMTDFMHKTVRASFLDYPRYQAAQLSTKLGEMVFILPDEGVTPEELLQNLDLFFFLDFSGKDAHYGEVQWSVPKFDVDSSLDLMDTLAALGVTDLPDPDKADLSSLTTLDAFLSGAQQLARVKVDEEGVEAAAVTIMTVDSTAMPEPDPEICVMDLDRPFLFVIRTAGIPLFVGVVNEL